MTEYCPNTDTCPFYLNLSFYKGQIEGDVISFSGSAKTGGIIHDCMALTALDKSITRVPIGHKLKEKIASSSGVKNVQCPLNSLNHEGFLEAEVNRILDRLWN